MQGSLRTSLGDLTEPLLSFLNSYGVKRIVDVGGALLALVILSPALLVCAVAVRLSGAPSVVFCQERVGRDGTPFQILKFTTMGEGAHLAGPLITAANDVRLTRVGRILRPFHLDELLQFVNVIRGEMSIVGPRPSVSRFVDWWPQGVREKVLTVRPGITSLATLYFCNEAALLAGQTDVERAYLEDLLPQRLSLDLWYMSNRTLWLDLHIMFSTLVKVLSGSRLFDTTTISARVLSSEITT